jgi:uncharacterized protein (DUF2147 family)
LRRIWIVAVVLMMLTSARAEQSGVLGQWTTPAGATVAVYRCDSDICAKLLTLGRNPAGRLDANNPDAALRTRSLCGLQIGRGFHVVDSHHTDGGQLYDPRSGKTYDGSMVSDGDSLKLRGYIGIKLFGRTEVWTREHGDVPACKE